MNSKHPYKRRSYFINKRFQLKYTLIVLISLISVMLITAAGMYIGLWASIAEYLNESNVSQDLETAKRISGYENVRYKKGDWRLDKTSREAELLSREQRNTLEGALDAVNESLIPKIVMLIFFLFLAGIFVSHKIAGPMYRFEHSAEAIKNGDLTVNFNIRKNDAMKKTASTLEEMLDALRSDIERLKAAKDALKKGYSEAALREIEDVLSKYKI